MSFPNPFEPIQPVIDFINPILIYVVHHPIQAIAIILLALFLVTGLVQSIMEWSRKFWDNIFLYSGKFVRFLLKSLWQVVVLLFRLIKRRFVPSTSESV